MAQSTLIDLIEAMADQIRDALDAAAAGTDLSVQVEPRRVFAPTTPTVDIYPAADDFRAVEGATMGQVSGVLRLTVRVRIDTGDQDASQDLLLDMQDDASAWSVAQALYDDATLNGHASDVYVESFSGHRAYEEFGGGGVYLGCEWTVQVWRAFS